MSPRAWAASSSRWYSARVNSRSDLRNICRWSRRYRTLQSSRPMQTSSLFTAASMALTLTGR